MRSSGSTLMSDSVLPLDGAKMLTGVVTPFLVVGSALALAGIGSSESSLLSAYPLVFLAAVVVGAHQFVKGLGSKLTVLKACLFTLYLVALLPALWLFGTLASCALGLECL